MTQSKHDAGPLEQARTLEPLALLWISLAIAQGYWPYIAFDLGVGSFLFLGLRISRPSAY
jgi:hypothetical protein